MKDSIKREQRQARLHFAELGRSVTTQGVDEGDEFTIDNTPSVTEGSGVFVT